MTGWFIYSKTGTVSVLGEVAAGVFPQAEGARHREDYAGLFASREVAEGDREGNSSPSSSRENARQISLHSRVVEAMAGSIEWAQNRR